MMFGATFTGSTRAWAESFLYDHVSIVFKSSIPNVILQRQVAALTEELAKSKETEQQAIQRAELAEAKKSWITGLRGRRWEVLVLIFLFRHPDDGLATGNPGLQA